MTGQLPLPFAVSSAFRREDFLISLGNAEAVAFIDAWPEWQAPAAAIYGPAGCGKSHLAAVWARRGGALIVEAATLEDAEQGEGTPLAIENWDGVSPSEKRDRVLFRLLEQGAPLLMTGREPPAAWPVALPDLASRLAAMLAFALWAPDDALLAALAQRLFTERQLNVPDSVIMRMIVSLDRSPAAIRDFVARADARALAAHRPVTLALVRDLLAGMGASP